MASRDDGGRVRAQGQEPDDGAGHRDCNCAKYLHRTRGSHRPDGSLALLTAYGQICLRAAPALCGRSRASPSPIRIGRAAAWRQRAGRAAAPLKQRLRSPVSFEHVGDICLLLKRLREGRTRRSTSASNTTKPVCKELSGVLPVYVNNCIRIGSPLCASLGHVSLRNGCAQTPPVEPAGHSTHHSSTA